MDDASKVVGKSKACLSLWERHESAIGVRQIGIAARYYGVLPEEIRSHNRAIQAARSTLRSKRTDHRTLTAERT